MTLSIEGAHTCPNCGEKVTDRFAHVFYGGGRCTIVELRPVHPPKANHIEGPLDRCPHCRDTVREGTMHTRQTGGRCTVTHVMRKEGVRGIHPPGHTPQEPPHHVKSPERLTPRLKGHTREPEDT